MNRSYDDIIDKMNTPPIWWQEGGIPRFKDFEPEFCTAVGATEAVLAEIACQACDTNFVVLMESGDASRKLAAAIESETLHYGDPPNVGCCSSGPTMGSVLCQVLEYWACADPKYLKDGTVSDMRFFVWERDRRLEKKFQSNWGGHDKIPSGKRWAPSSAQPSEQVSVWGTSEVHYGLLEKILMWLRKRQS